MEVSLNDKTSTQVLIPTCAQKCRLVRQEVLVGDL